MSDLEVVRHAFAWRTTAEAEHDLHQWWGTCAPRSPALFAATHFLPEHSGVAVTIEHADGELTVIGAGDPSHAGWALEHHRHRTGGRLFLFPGSQSLVGTTAVGAVLGLTAVDEVVGIGVPSVDASTPLHTQEFVRPTFERGRVRLLVRPAPGGAVVPFEQPEPTPCCATHG
ncbi:hypothetical protein V3N99_06735 [Dermatophilaceae bacterium Soc4.6]